MFSVLFSKQSLLYFFDFCINYQFFWWSFDRIFWLILHIQTHQCWYIWQKYDAVSLMQQSFLFAINSKKLILITQEYQWIVCFITNGNSFNPFKNHILVGKSNALPYLISFIFLTVFSINGRSCIWYSKSCN